MSQYGDNVNYDAAFSGSNCSYWLYHPEPRSCLSQKYSGFLKLSPRIDGQGVWVYEGWTPSFFNELPCSGEFLRG